MSPVNLATLSRGPSGLDNAPARPRCKRSRAPAESPTPPAYPRRGRQGQSNPHRTNLPWPGSGQPARHTQPLVQAGTRVPLLAEPNLRVHAALRQQKALLAGTVFLAWVAEGHE